IALPGISPRKRGERSGCDALGSAKAVTPSPFSPFTGRRWRQPDEGRRQRNGIKLRPRRKPTASSCSARGSPCSRSQTCRPGS
ncbi:MAG: hypothetical protein E5V78_28765, partial [Mesorhizobium sp.]